MIIGITGKSGSGKSTLSKIMSIYGQSFYHIEIDKIGHQVLDIPEIQNQIRATFNIEVSSTNRTELGDLIFNNRNNMAQLSDIVYYKMKEIIDKEISEHKNCILDWILLPHTHYFNLCDITILVKPASEETRCNKVCERDKLKTEKLKQRDSASIQYNEQDFDFIITNNYSIDIDNLEN